jgi:hypothetical protein
MKNIQYGGLALRNPENYKDITDDKKKYEKALYDMIDKATNIHCISYSSLEGFIFTITVNEANAVFNGLNEKSEFIKPISTVLLKLVLIKRYGATTNNFEFIIDDKKIRKRAATIDSFNNEINVQYDVYKNTLNYNNIPICPSIIYNNVIDMKSQILRFLLKIKGKGRQSIITSEIIEDLFDIYNAPKKIPTLGIIGMEFADDYQTLDSYIDDKENSYSDGSITEENDMYTLQTCETDCKCVSSIIVNIIRLFISSGIIHLDLHSGNIMINKKLHTSEIIDFGIIEPMTITQNNIEYYTYENLIFDKKTNKPSVESLNNYLYTNLGSASKYIGNGEQLFMQEYLYGITGDDERCKKILKLFLLIILSDRDMKYLRLGVPITQMLDLLKITGLKITPNIADRRLMTTMDKIMFDINSLDDKNITLDQWINNNIQPLFRLFFKNVILQVYLTCKDYYILQDFTVQPSTDAVFRIGADEGYKYKKVASNYKYGMGGSKKICKTKRMMKSMMKRIMKRKQTRKHKRKI